MELPVKAFSNRGINKAGESLRENRSLLREANETLFLISDWRSSHEPALNKVMTVLRKHTKSRGWNSIISGRTKRIRSIVAKLVRKPTMALSTMQDIGGCRVVLDDVGTTELLAESVRNELRLAISSGGEIHEDDYVAKPKPDGYRSIHFVVRYKILRPSEFKPFKIEIQLRSLVQHRWATALETVDLFTGQTLKTGGGDPRWKRFFILASSVFAIQEQRPLVPNAPSNPKDLDREMRALAEELHVVAKLQGWSRAMRDVLNSDRRALKEIYCYLIELDVKKNTTQVTPYRIGQLQDAHKKYMDSERNNPQLSTVLVTAPSLEEVKESFPGFYGDTKAFLRAVGLVV